MSSELSENTPSRGARVGRRILYAAQAAAAIALVTVPFGWATTAAPDRVALGAVSGLAVGLGLCLRLGERNGRLVGILVGALVGVAATLIAAGYSANPGPLIPPVLALAVGLMDGLGPSRLAGYREAFRESLLVSGLLGFGLFFGPLGVLGAVGALVVVPATTLYAGLSAGFFDRGASGRRFARPPLLLLAAFAAMFVLVTLTSAFEARPDRSLPDAAFRAAASLILVPLPVFLGARALAGFLRPRLRVYLDLAEYLRVMWIPMGGFAIGYLAIIVVFAGFSGMLERFHPGSFAGAAGAGVGDWILFSFFAAIAEPYSPITPASAAARLLTGAQLVLSVGWALVVFAAVMSAIQPQLDRIARRCASDRDPDSP